MFPFAKSVNHIVRQGTNFVKFLQNISLLALILCAIFPTGKFSEHITDGLLRYMKYFVHHAFF